MNILRALFVCTALVQAALATDFHVAPNGNDANPGTQAKPFATLERARDAIRELKQAGPLKEPVTVRLGGGTYPLAQEVRFGPEDSGTAACPITYTAAGPEPVVLDGGRRITGWKKHDDKLWVADVPDVASGAWRFRQLYVNGQQRVRARTPNAGYPARGRLPGRHAQDRALSQGLPDLRVQAGRHPRRLDQPLRRRGHRLSLLDRFAPAHQDGGYGVQPGHLRAQGGQDLHGRFLRGRRALHRGECLRRFGRAGRVVSEPPHRPALLLSRCRARTWRKPRWSRRSLRRTCDWRASLRSGVTSSICVSATCPLPTRILNSGRAIPTTARGPPPCRPPSRCAAPGLARSSNAGLSNLGTFGFEVMAGCSDNEFVGQRNRPVGRRRHPRGRRQGNAVRPGSARATIASPTTGCTITARIFPQRSACC